MKLENLDIKANAFDDLELPIRILQGHLGMYLTDACTLNYGM